MAARASIGQAAANALAAWLQTQLDSDIVIAPRWPDPGKPLPAKAVTVIRVGTPSRVDVSCLALVSRVNISPTVVRSTWQFGSMTQALQLDLWATNDFDRDDMLAQLSDALTAGIEQTLCVGVDPNTVGITGDPVRDGVLVPFLAADGYPGNADFCFDTPMVDDDPQSIQRKEYRATYHGEAQFAYVVTRDTPRILAATLKQKVHQGAVAPVGMLYDTTTVAPNPTPPPAAKITHGTSS
jgi:hypothetical protein